MRRVALAVAVAVAAAAPACGVDQGERGEPPARTAAAARDRRAPDRVGRLTGVGEGGTFACRTGGRLDVRLAGVDAVTLHARGRPLAYGGVGTRLVGRDCRRVAAAPHPFSRLAGNRWRGPRLAIMWRAGVLRCDAPAIVHVDLRTARAAEPAVPGGPPSTDGATELFVLGARTGRLLAFALLRRMGSRVVSTPACRRPDAPRVAP